ncbi:MAG: DNA replication and repair protein RecF, partial [Prevotella sp.]|nr:DNA replication and repair protein RecF [Prevotella sp.]
MILQRLDIINYRNLAEAHIEPSPKLNAFIGANGAGKTNILDTIYYLAFTRSAINPTDTQVIHHEADFFMLDSVFAEEQTADAAFRLTCSLQRGQKKHLKRDGKEYRRLADHIGLVPVVSVSPDDQSLIVGGSEERRRLMDMVISLQDRPYLEALTRYAKALQQRNALLRQEQEPDPDVMDILEQQMATEGEAIYQRRESFTRQLLPLFQEFYNIISGRSERVELGYQSHCQRGPLLDVISRDRWRDRAVGYSLHGVHRDDLLLSLDDHPLRREGSQGQHKTFLVALKLAQYEFLKASGRHTAPLLLLDDIFDKLDADRVEQLVTLVAGTRFGQIFITDT